MSSGPESQRPVMVAYDGSDQAKAAIATAGGLLTTGRRALVLTVWQPLESIPFWGVPMPVVPQETIERVMSQAKVMAAEGADLARAAGFDPEPRTAEGNPVWWPICEIAAQSDAELIVMGSRGRSGIAYAFMGSVATAVCHHAGCAVMVGGMEPRG